MEESVGLKAVNSQQITAAKTPLMGADGSEEAASPMKQG